MTVTQKGITLLLKSGVTGEKISLPEDHNRIRPNMEKLGFAYRIENDHVFEWHSDALHVELHYRYEILRNHPVLLPVFWVVRWIRILFFRRQNLRRKLNTLRTLDDESVRDYERSLQLVGLEFHY